MRGRREGTIYGRTDGRWVWTIYDDNGVKHTKYAKTEAAAIAAKKKAMREGIPEGALTLEQWMALWLDAKPNLAVKTREGYESHAKRIYADLGKIRVHQLTPEQIEAAYKAWRKDLSERTILHLHRLLHGAMKAAFARGLATRNVVDLVPAPSPKKYRASPFNLQDANTVLEVARKRRNGARWWVALYLGLRNGEALGLRWSDVDLDSGVLTISGQVQRHKGKGLVRIPDTKTHHDRAIPMPPALIDVLKKHRDDQRKEAKKLGTVPEFVFTDSFMRPIAPEADHREWKIVLEVAHLPHVRIYDCRHTCATLLLEQGVQAKVVAEILGHSTIRLTLDTYTQVREPLMASALDSLTAALTAIPTAPTPIRSVEADRPVEQKAVRHRKRTGL